MSDGHEWDTGLGDYYNPAKEAHGRRALERAEEELFKALRERMPPSMAEELKMIHL